MIHGMCTALITPFSGGNIDYKSFTHLIKWQLSSGVNGVVLLGSTGESATLTDEERTQLLTFAIKEVRAHKKDIPIIVGTGTASTIKTLEYTKQAKKLGADAALIVCPYYNKPSDRGMYEHFKFINDNVDLPIIIYNNPTRTVVNLSNETLARLSRLKNIIGIKDSTGDLARPLHLTSLLDSGSNFLQISGEDNIAVSFNLSGGKGVISVAGNIIPKELVEVQRLTLNGEYIIATQKMHKYHHLIKLLFCETNPIPIKYAAFKMGVISSPEMRLPLLSLSEHHQRHIDEEMAKLGLI